jgi:hypothetical protein
MPSDPTLQLFSGASGPASINLNATHMKKEPGKC